MNQNRNCSQCQTPLPPDVRFCTMCGHPIDAPPPPAAPVVQAPGAPLPPVVPVVQPRAASKTPASQSAGRIVGVIIMLITLLAGGGAYRFRNALGQLLHMKPAVKSTTNTQTPKSSSNTSSTSPVDNLATPEENELDGPLITAQDAAYYLPMPYRSYRYYEWYPDGDKGEWTQITASLREPLLISTIEVLDDPPNYIRAAFHYLQKGGDIYQVEDSQPKQAELILSSPLKVGAVIKSQGVTGTITKINASCTTGGRTFKGCLVISRNYTAADYRDIEYWAPEYGLVLVEAPDGTPVRTLLKVKDVDVQEAVDRVAKATPNIEKVQVP